MPYNIDVSSYCWRWLRKRTRNRSYSSRLQEAADKVKQIPVQL